MTGDERTSFKEDELFVTPEEAGGYFGSHQAEMKRAMQPGGKGINHYFMLMGLSLAEIVARYPLGDSDET